MIPRLLHLSPPEVFLHENVPYEKLQGETSIFNGLRGEIRLPLGRDSHCRKKCLLNMSSRDVLTVSGIRAAGAERRQYSPLNVYLFYSGLLLLTYFYCKRSDK